MATLGRLVVPVSAPNAGFARDLARAAKLADSWSKSVGSRVDAAFAGLARGAPLKSVAGALDAIGKGASVARAALAIGDVYRASRAAGLGLDRLRLAFTLDADKAAALRNRIGATSASLDAMRGASLKARAALFGVDLGVFAGKLGVVAGRAIPGLVSGLSRTVLGLSALGAGVATAAVGVVSFVPDVARMTKGFYNAATAAKGSASRAVEFLSALYYGKRAASTVVDVGLGFKRVVGGAASAARGVVGLGASLAKVGWKATIAGASAFAKTLGGVGSAALSVVAGLGKVAAVGGLIGATLGVKAAASAAHLEEAFNKTKQIFGEFAGGVLADAKTMNVAFAVNQREFLDGATAIGSMLKGMGYAAGDSAKLGSNLARLAADTKAFRDVRLEEALGKIRAGLAGESEPLQAYGIDLRDAALEAYAFSTGLAKAGTELTQTQKTQARLALITQGLKADMGALGREATGPAAQIAEFWGRLETLTETVGQSLAPALGNALQGINVAIVALTTAWDESKGSVLAWFGVTNESLSQANGGVGVLQKSIGWLADAWTIVKGATAGFFSYFEAGLSRITGWLSQVFGALEQIGAGEWAGNTRKFLEEYSASAKTVSEDLFKTTQDAFSGKNLASGAVDEYFAKAQAKVDEARAKLAGTLDFATKVAPKPLYEAPDRSKAARDSFAAAALRNSKEAASTIFRTKFGGAKDDVANNTKVTAKNTAAAAKASADTVTAIKSLTAQLAGAALPPLGF